MTTAFNLLSVVALFESSSGDAESNRNYKNTILRRLQKILPKKFFILKESQESTLAHQYEILNQLVPLITHSEIKEFPGIISFFVLSKYRSNSFKFFFEMISRWLVPGNRLNVVLVYASDFKLVQLSDQVYTICEMMIQINDREEYQHIQQNFPIIGTEINLGIHSEFYAQRILETKGLSADDKTALIQNFIAYLVKRFPTIYDQDIFTEMQHVLVTCRDDFKAMRKFRHLSRIINIRYLFRRALKEAVKKKSTRRYLNLKVFRATLEIEKEIKPILGIQVGFNFLREHEIFEENHLIKAIKHFLPSAVMVANSFQIQKLGAESICLAYIEIEKIESARFTCSEIKKLQKELPAHLKNRIEHRIHPVFMPRNEEEIMRNILTLTHQLKFIRDIPQVLVNFEEQTHSHLYFTVILARVVKSNSRNIMEIIQEPHPFVKFLFDRTREMGFIRNKYVKEAAVFRMRLLKKCYLRSDHSIDLYKARQVIVSELCKKFGEIRDYNGGMITKQQELFSSIQHLLKDCKDYDEFLFENFFYSISPVIARTLLDPEAFKTLFFMLNEGIKEYKQEGYYLKFQCEPHHSFALIIVEDFSIKELLNKKLHALNCSAVELASASVKTHGNMCLGYIYRTHKMQKKEFFISIIETCLKQWENTHCISLK